MYSAWQTVAHVILLQVALAFYVLVWPLMRKGAFLSARKLSKWFPGAEASEETGTSDKQPYRGKWRDAQSDRSGHWNRTEQARRPAKPPLGQPERRKCLAILGLKEPVHLMEIKTAYRQMAKVYHPDRFASNEYSDADRRSAAAKMRDLNAAYD